MTRAYRIVRFPRAATLAALLSACLLLQGCVVGTRPSTQKWVASWGQAMTSQYVHAVGNDGKLVMDAYGQPLERVPTVDHLTLRQSVNLSAGGERVRIRLSNYYGREPLTVSAAHIALGAGHAGDLSAIDPGSDRPLSFDGGNTSITIAPGSEAVSDPVELRVPPLSNVVVSLYFDGPAQLADFHPLERAHTTYAVDGDAMQRASLAQLPPGKALPTTRDDHIYLLSGVEVEAQAGTRGIVAFGDSITDGYLARAPTASWPAVLARVAQRNGDAAAVVNAGISADELTVDQIGAPDAGTSGLKRFLRDVVDRPGVTDVVVLFGANDINRGIDAAGYPDGATTGDLVASMRMLADVAHQHHLRIYAGTVTPFAGFPGWYTPRREAVWLQFNQWIRSSATFDGVVDFADAVAGTYVPPPLVAKQSPLPVGMAAVCAGDAGLHPNDRGYAVMGTLAYDVLFHAELQPPQGCH
ncbi:GDSL family lipase [Rhodanobacter sp. 7MK24]|uniref:GDSL-type esterase/lipase family protein n=1 Tax=Rhodanobacter sp. 7MK24 TaxID=2775922 RepID=UPI001785CBB2|nr:GDSL-type esterase/lipase family protein [Rhodanobacter sp. 7MK24]MBD8879525.1 GDSL family lipase [Rhodanobacter sp. 7MK24]